MCGKFRQLSSWREVHAFSQPLVVEGRTDEVIVSTPMQHHAVERSGRAELVGDDITVALAAVLAEVKPSVKRRLRQPLHELAPTCLLDTSSRQRAEAVDE
jgi:hypothetical protein